MNPILEVHEEKAHHKSLHPEKKPKPNSYLVLIWIIGRRDLWAQKGKGDTKQHFEHKLQIYTHNM